MIDLSVVIPTWNTRELTLGCLAAVDRELRSADAQSNLRLEVIVVDNGSTDGTASAIRSACPWVELRALTANRGFAAGCNAGLAGASGEVILLLNSDALVRRETVEGCLAVLREFAEVAAVGPQLLHADGRLQNSIHAFPSLWTEVVPIAVLESLLPRRYPSKRYPHSSPFEVDAILGAAFFVRRRAIDEIGPLCEDYFFFLEETDWCWRMRAAGWRVMHAPGTSMVHLSGASAKATGADSPGARNLAGLARIEYHRSLYHFLRQHRGIATLAGAVALRFVRCAISILLFAPLAIFSTRQRRRLFGRWQLLTWHLGGCRRNAGLRSGLEAAQN